MQYHFPRIPLHSRPAHRRRKLLLQKLLLPLGILFIISVTTTFAQSQKNTLYLYGQVCNIDDGAPIENQVVYIESNVSSVGGMSIYRVKHTDDQGFFYDTLRTTAEKGSLHIYTYDIYGNEYETEEYFRFRWENTYHTSIKIDIQHPGGASEIQANFTPELDSTNLEKLSYFFNDQSTGADIASWSWDFGDGSTSTESDPHHTYAKPGIYDVTLSISNHRLTADIVTSTVTRKLKVGMLDYYHFGGHAFAGYFPVDKGTAFLYKIENDIFLPIDTTEFDTLGYYFFYQLIEGDYKVKTFPSPQSQHAGSYLPTYFGNSLFWTKAKIIALDETGWEYDISMIQNFSFDNGMGKIDGQVSGDGKNTALDDIQIILFNENDNCLTYIKSDQKGNFKFSGLAYGTYKLLAEVPGKYTYPMSVTITENNPIIEDINIIIYNEDIHYGIDDGFANSLTGLGDPYPNPARSNVKLDFCLLQPGMVQVFILNPNGQVAGKQQAFYHKGEHEIQLNTSALSAGMYKLMVLFDNEKHIKSFIKVN